MSGPLRARRTARPAGRARTSAGAAAGRASAPRGPRASTLLACAAIMVAALLAVLLLNIALSRGSYEEDRLTARQTVLAQRQQALVQALDASAAPSALASRAAALGLAPAARPGYLRLSDGKVLGSPSPVAAPTRSPVASASP